MSLHVFGTILTARSVAANNRGENEGNATTLQKVVRDGALYSTVSGEAVRYALREVWSEDDDLELNRVVSHRGSEWRDSEFKKGWEKYIDNDVLGYMHAKRKPKAAAECWRSAAPSAPHHGRERFVRTLHRPEQIRVLRMVIRSLTPPRCTIRVISTLLR